MLLYFYLRRLRVHAVQELLAGLGVAIAVALVFAVLVANASIGSSAGEVVHTLIGPASLQLRARNPDGFDERLLTQVQSLPGVTQTAPVLEVPATITGPHGRQVTVGVAGARPSLALMDGLAHTIPLTTLSPGEIGLSQTTAEKIGVPGHSLAGSHATASEVSLELRGAAEPLRVAAVLGAGDIGALSAAQVAIMPLGSLQRLAGLDGRITRILIQTAPGHEAAVRRELTTLAGGWRGRAGGIPSLAPADEDIALLGQALAPGDQASEFFAAVAVLLGFLLALDAMLLTVPERRRAIMDLRLLGAHRAAIVRMVLFQALCLGLLSSFIGLVGGYALSLGVLHQSGDYLAPGFTLGTRTVVGTGPLLLSPVCGVLATCLAAALPLVDLRHGRTPGAGRDDRPSGDALSRGAQVRLVLAATICLALTTIGIVLFPAFALIVGIGLTLTCVLAVPVLFGVLLRCADALLARFQRLSTLAITLSSLRSVTLRSLTLAATGAVALFGGVALGGARDDLLRGIEGFSHAYVTGAAVWIANPGDHQSVDDFRAGRDAARIARVPGVAGVRAFGGTFVTLDGRRVWITVRPPGTSGAILHSQLVTGDAITAAARLDADGWIVLSQQIAAERYLTLGGVLTLPTPTGPHAYRIAALSTNFGWSPGTIVMSPVDYTRAWQITTPTALGVTLTPGASAASVRSAITRELGMAGGGGRVIQSGLQVLTAREREAEIDAFVSEGLSRLGEISTLLILGAILALAAALTSSIHQRRRLLAELRLAGGTPQRLRAVLLIETTLTLGAGCLTGVLAGVYGEILIDRSLTHLTGFPVASPTASPRPLELLALVIIAVLAIVTIPGRRASRVTPIVALQE